MFEFNVVDSPFDLFRAKETTWTFFSLNLIQNITNATSITHRGVQLQQKMFIYLFKNLHSFCFDF